MNYMIVFAALALLYVFVFFRKWKDKSRASLLSMAGGVLGYGLSVMFRPVTVWVLKHLEAR